jgi:5-methylthioribose kinase
MEHLHREDCLEAEIRRLRQALHILTEAVLAGDMAAALIEAEACQKVLDPDR